jgi:release factor glutamine methyltransferase
VENKPNTVSSILQVFRAELKNDYDEKEIRQFLNILFNEWLGWNRARVLLNQDEKLSEEEVSRFLLALEDLKIHKPIQYITGRIHFLDLDLLVTPDVLIPRPETEELVHMIIKENKSKQHEEFSMLDIGTGSGCIALSLKKNFPFSLVSAMDISLNALQLARKNADRNGCDILFVHHDILQKNGDFIFPGFDIIISNPPYITESEKKEMLDNVLDYEPYEALFVPDLDPLVYYKAIADFSVTHLFRSGLLYFEINERFGQEIKQLLLKMEFEKVEVLKDLNGKDRFIRAESITRQTL